MKNDEKNFLEIYEEKNPQKIQETFLNIERKSEITDKNNLTVSIKGSPKVNKSNTFRKQKSLVLSIYFFEKIIVITILVVFRRCNK